MTDIVEVPRALATTVRGQAEMLRIGMDSLRRDDSRLAAFLDAEVDYQSTTLAMVASASIADPSVLAAAGSALSNVTAEGYPGARYHSGATWFDQVENLAVERAKTLFGARYANVQPHSCTSANLAVLAALVPPGGTLLGLRLDAGGHLTHGSAASITGRHYHAVHYGLDSSGRIDYDQVAALAQEHRPGVLIAGASAYPRAIDFDRFRAIADSVGAYLLADISHIAGLVAAGAHPSPIDSAHITTTSTYKQLGGPRGGLILSGQDYLSPGPDNVPLARLMQQTVFPRCQGTPNPAAIAAKARAFALAAGPEFHATAHLIVENAQALADALAALGYQIVTSGTDNHIVLIDLTQQGLTGAVAEQALEQCGILTNRNSVPGDAKPSRVTSGLRLGTNILAQRGMRPQQMRECANLLHRVLSTTTTLDDTTYHLAARTTEHVRAYVHALCDLHPMPVAADR
jgi:glycine hydroxymethyltransferase